MRPIPLTVEAALARAVGTLIEEGERVLLACSGGADSVALVSAAAREARLRCAVGHVDHGLRPESAREAGTVRALAAALGLPFFLERLEGLSVAGAGLERAAREARYAALARLAAQAGASVVLTAHTRRDQAETLLLRLARGAGPGALSGVRATRPLAAGVRLVRPLLTVPRAETERHCREHALGFVDDPHNRDPARARAQVRAAWDVLAGLNPRLEESLAGAAALFADDDDLVAGLARTALERLSPEGSLDAAGLAALHPALQRRCLLDAAVAAGLRPERHHLEELRQSLSRERFALSLPGGTARLARGRLVFGGFEAKARPAPEVAVGGPGSYAWNSRVLAVALGRGKGTTVDLARAPFPWKLRGHRSGDRFRPGGGRTRKVADLWIDARIPRERRPRLGVLEDAAGNLFWVEGIRSGEAGRGEQAAPATFVIEPEMEGATGALVNQRQDESASATMLVREPNEET